MPSHSNHSNELNTFTPFLNITVPKKSTLLAWWTCWTSLRWNSTIHVHKPQNPKTETLVVQRSSTCCRPWTNHEGLKVHLKMGKEIGPGKKKGIQKAKFLGLRVNISRWEITFSYGAGAMLQKCGKGNPGSRIVSVWHLLSSYFWDAANLEIHTGNSHLGFPIRL